MTGLYPSIMRTHNYCFTTSLPPQRTIKSNSEYVDHETCPDTGASFAKSSARVGVLPLILSNILSARKRAKIQKNNAYKENDMAKVVVMDGRQLALKIIANSVYGFSGVKLTRAMIPNVYEDMNGV